MGTCRGCLGDRRPVARSGWQLLDERLDQVWDWGSVVLMGSVAIAVVVSVVLGAGDVRDGEAWMVPVFGACALVGLGIVWRVARILVSFRRLRRSGHDVDLAPRALAVESRVCQHPDLVRFGWASGQHFVAILVTRALAAALLWWVLVLLT